MKVLVLGAGVVGVTTAYELLQDGHEVVVLERESTPAQGASHANAGLLVPGAALAWGSPERLHSLPKVWLGLEQAMRIGFPGPHLISWGLRFLKECTTEAWRRNTLIRQRLSLYSQTVMAAVLAESGVKYDHRTGGVLSIFRDSRSLEHGNRLRDILREDGQKYELLDAAQLVKLEPAFANARTTLAGAILCPTDESGDCHGFTQNLAQICQARGAAFQFGVTARHFISDGNQVTKVATDHGEFSADAFVLCLGCWSPQLAGSLGETLSIYPVKGLSLTLPIESGHQPPTLSCSDQDAHIACSRFGDRLRVSSLAAFVGFNTKHRPRQFEYTLKSIRELFPNGADYERPKYWAGLRPVTPDSAPILGRGRHHNLLFNTGHGSLGWTMACGSARITADLLLRQPPGTDLSGLGPR